MTTTPEAGSGPAPYYADGQVTLHLGKMLDVLPAIPDASIDAIVCDPPYGLADLHPRIVTEALTAWLTGDRSYVPADRRGGFMGAEWDRFVPPPAAWDECLRVLKPGGHLVAFAAPRTADLMGLSIRLAGFQIRDTITWLYAQGFPKSLDASKAIDKAAGAERAVIGPSRRHGGGTNNVYAQDTWTQANQATMGTLTAPATVEAERWEGWGTALKPASEPIIVARKPLAGTVAATVLAFGTGALNIDGCRVEPTGESRKRSGEASQQRRYASDGGTNFAALPGVRGGDPAGRWPTNVVFTHAALLNSDGEILGDACAAGCVPGCPVAELDRQTAGTRASKPSKTGRAGGPGGDIYGGGKGLTRGAEVISRDDVGPARFFPTFRYAPKAPSSERPRLADGTAHPTVKPVALMQWLVRLVTPPGGLVLDPFAGTGTTLAAAIAEGMRAVGIEQHQPYADLTVARLTRPIALGLFGEETA